MVKRARWFVIIDNCLYPEPGKLVCHQTRQGKPHESYTSFFTPEYVKSLFRGATIHPPVCREWQHCCVVRNGTERGSAG